METLTTIIAAPLLGTALLYAYLFTQVGICRLRRIAHARRVVRQHIAAACKGDHLSRLQVIQASAILNQYNL